MNNTPELTYTLQDFVDLRDADPLTYYNLSVLLKSITLPNLFYSSDNIVYDYIGEFKNVAKTVVLSDEDLIKYQYKPKLLSYYLYGSAELYFVLLALNGTCNIKDFNMKRFKALRPDDMNNLLNAIYNAETEYITYNRSELNLEMS